MEQGRVKELSLEIFCVSSETAPLNPVTDQNLSFEETRAKTFLSP